MAYGRRSVAVRPLARRDIDDAIDHYLEEAGKDVASGFVDAVLESFRIIARNPGLGSPRFASIVSIAGLRSWPLRPWPYLIFYVDERRTIDVLRVLHGARDIPATLIDAE